MNGVTKEGLVGWEASSAKVTHEPMHEAVILAYRLLKRADHHGLANAVRSMANEAVVKGFELAEVKRLAESGKIGQKWEDFVRPFAAMDGQQLGEWIATFKAAVLEEKGRQAALARMSRAKG